uniref:CHK domain-containing protein n=1 Tax=Caenorhabditis japonica TaxID=281687 RepID=A0A8R1I4K0_CAEJA
MKSKLKQLRRLVKNSFLEIPNFYAKVDVEFEKMENAKSFWSEVYVAHLKVKEGHECEEIGAIPESVFIKIPRISENVHRCEEGNEVDELNKLLVYFSKKENLFYKHFPFETIPNFPIPRVYYTEDIKGEATGGLVAENLAAEMYAEEHLPGLSEQQVLRLMEALGGLHAHLLKLENKEYIKSFEEGAHGTETYSPDMQKSMFEETLTLESLSPAHFGDGRVQKIAWAFDYENKNRAMQDCVSAIPGIVVHADLNVTNILWKNNSFSSEIGAIIDYQMVIIGSVAHDIIRVLSLGLTRNVRQEKTEEYLRHYYRTFEGFFDKGHAPFTMEELHRQYALIFPFASNFTLFGIALYIKMYHDGTLGAADKKEQNVQELVDRALGIVEDIEAFKKISYS